MRQSVCVTKRDANTWRIEAGVKANAVPSLVGPVINVVLHYATGETPTQQHEPALIVAASCQCGSVASTIN